MEMTASVPVPEPQPTRRAPGNPRVALLEADWPQADRLAWERAQKPGNPLLRPGAACAWRPATRKSAAGAYGRWLAFLASRGELNLQAAAGQPATEHITEARMYEYGEHLRTRCSTGTVASYVALLVMMAKALAPKRDWAWLQALQKQLQFAAVPVRNKRPRMVPAGELFRLGLELIVAADARTEEAGLTRHSAQDYRDGLMIALLASRPLRVKNFVEIKIGRHLVQTSNGYALTFAPDETKTKKTLDNSIPEHLVPLLERYLDTYRPFLLALRETRGLSRRNALAPAGTALWVTQYGTGFSANTARKVLEKHTTARFGKYVNPHLFRDCAASSIANEDPEHVRIAAQVLGHTQFTTTETYYIQAETGVATRGYHAQILALRKDGQKRRFSRHG